MQAFDKVTTVTIAVEDQDEALNWYTEKLGFETRTDNTANGMRWLTVAPSQQIDVEFLLASWFPDHIGKNATWVMSTRDCANAYAELSGKGIEFSQKPERRAYGIEAVFADLYGNKYALLESPAGEVVTELDPAIPDEAGSPGTVLA